MHAIGRARKQSVRSPPKVDKGRREQGDCHQETALAAHILLETVLALALTGGAAASQQRQPPQTPEMPDVSDFRPERDLSSYRTYAWNKSQNVPTENMANHLRIVNAIQEQMKQRGYRIDTVNPEIRIRYRLELQQRVRGTTTQQRSVWDNASSTVQIDINTVKQAHFSIQCVEADSNFFLWQAEGTYPMGTPDRAEILIKEAVQDLFEQFPSPK